MIIYNKKRSVDLRKSETKNDFHSKEWQIKFDSTDC